MPLLPAASRDRHDSPQVTALSVIVPAYNEAGTLRTVLERVLRLPIADLDVVVVDDGSDDGTGEIAERVAEGDPRVRVLHHPKNRGKGAAVRSALAQVRGDVVVVQDADLECDPAELPRLLRLFEDSQVRVVYGVRRASPESPYVSRLARTALTRFTNILFGSRISDVSTCYKMLRGDVMRRIRLEKERFEFCAEITAKLLLAGYRIEEVEISYTPRTRAQGKKIRFLDGVRTVWTLLELKSSSWLAERFEWSTRRVEEIEGLRQLGKGVS
jgi:glycosyltransferase involved in cell wall biosynthesis